MDEIDKYIVDDKRILGKGAFSVVKLAKHQETGKKYALKKVK